MISQLVPGRDNGVTLALKTLVFNCVCVCLCVCLFSFVTEIISATSEWLCYVGECVILSRKALWSDIWDMRRRCTQVQVRLDPSARPNWGGGDGALPRQRNHYSAKINYLHRRRRGMHKMYWWQREREASNVGLSPTRTATRRICLRRSSLKMLNWSELEARPNKPVKARGANGLHTHTNRHGASDDDT